MINNIAYFPSQCAQNSRPVMSAVLDYLQARGIQTQENSMESDAAVIWSVLWAGRMAPNQAVYQHYRSQGKPVVIIEIGALYRGNTWKIAVNNINADGHYGHLDNLDWDRPKKLRISLATQFNPRPNSIVSWQYLEDCSKQHYLTRLLWPFGQFRLGPPYQTKDQSGHSNWFHAQHRRCRTT